MGRLALKRLEGIGSRGQDLMGDFLMRSWTSLIVSEVNSDRIDWAGGSGKRSMVVEGAGSGREERIVFTLLVKNSEKSLARASGGAYDGSTEDEELWSSLSAILKRVA